MKKQISLKSKIGIFIIIFSIIFVIFGSVLSLDPSGEIETYPDTKGTHRAASLILISPFLALIGLYFLYSNNIIKNRKNLKHFTFGSIILSIISIILVFLILYWFFTPNIDPNFGYGFIIIIFAPLIYFANLIYFRISYKNLKAV